MDYQGLALANEFQIDELFSLHYFEYMNSFYFPGESHPFWEFVCVDNGEVTIGAGDRSCGGDPRHNGFKKTQGNDSGRGGGAVPDAAARTDRIPQTG